MPKKKLELLTESMFYLLMAFGQGEMCGIDAAAWIEKKTGGRMRIGPATLYTILAKFLEEHYLEETDVSGRKRTYRMTAKGAQAYRDEVNRLTLCLRDAGIDWKKEESE